MSWIESFLDYSKSELGDIMLETIKKHARV